MGKTKGKIYSDIEFEILQSAMSLEAITCLGYCADSAGCLNDGDCPVQDKAIELTK